MSDTNAEIEAYVRDRIRRAVARSELRRLSKLAQSIESEERSDFRLACRIGLVIAAIVACIFLLALVQLVGSKASLLIVPILIIGIALISRLRRRNRTVRLDRSGEGHQRDSSV